MPDPDLSGTAGLAPAPHRLFFLGDGEMALPCIARGPATAPRATLVIVPPFAEEMNRCRLWLSQTMIRLASHDIQSLMFDLPGTGDSALPWPAARWDHWVEATRQAIAWGYKTGSTHVLAVRFGALLAAAACHNMPDKAASLILAAAQESGAMVLRSLLRVAGNPATLSQRLDAGDTIVAGGYVLHSSLTGPILQQKLGPLLDGLELKRAALDLTGVPSPWLQIEPEEPAALVESTVRQLLQLIGRAT